ncbi:Eco57I restriction-modification methylase domain-containing protein [Francisella tularensis subsp. novicida]|nr:Eco57I restriction-modification methylase domain-containing protein [Francisella tularensis]AJI45429.1 eco57I restriction-modification methylase family protein [Francisella tularensis subsp. novicida F6168]AJJ47931.1 eco57I restriction-modification methylase family protein [Francisella tularensis subsp. novicida]APC98190.1 eco57I restriction-modification methylase family protein [Francisella tularensis subsp. novicida]KFJ68418.1 eco57I restriction-modification methylase family protein [Franc
MLNFINQKYNQQDFLEFIQSKITSFEKNYEDLVDIENHKNIKQSAFLGSAGLDDGELGVFEFELTDSTDIENNRVSINTFLKKKVKDNILSGAIAVFYNPNKSVWRLSFIKIDYDENLQEFATPPTRASFILGENVPLKTVESQLSQISNSITSINSAFSVEPVSKKFFIEYKELYKKLCENIANYPKQGKTGFDDVSNVSFFVKKLLGRIVFLFFLQKKGWLGANDDAWTNGDRQFLVNLFENYKNNPTLYGLTIESKNFYNDLLAPLFFDALNTDRRQAEKPDYFDVLDCKIPYLNGGLFTKDERDIELEKNKIRIEDGLFEDLLRKEDNLQGKKGLFSSYNFTIIEDSPEDVDIAIDPEMLGKVFEDLLEDRKEKGAFYTPREIVHYMCQQSLINYLKGKFVSEEDEQDIKDLVLYKKTDNNTLVNKRAKEVKQALHEIKVLDPAIGSGAFPMGMLHEIVSALHSIDKSTNIAELKKQVIQNSIYGVDIEESAVEIAKLRFWLSIVVDSDKPEPLPNLFYKIMVGNSLLETINGYDPIGNRQSSIVREIQADIKEYYSCDDNKAKQIIKDKIHANLDKVISNKLNDKIKQYNENSKASLLNDTKAKQKEREKLSQDADLCQKILTDFKNHDYTTTELFFYKIYFADVLDNGGFDVVIGNPPYLRVQGIDRQISEIYKKQFKSATGSYDLYVLFCEKALSLVNDKGVVNYIMPHKWVNAAFGKGLREISQYNAARLISFGSYQVFNASTYTSLVWFTKSNNQYINYIESDKDLDTNKKLRDWLNSIVDSSYTKINSENLTSNTWNLTDRQTYDILQKISLQPLKVKDVFEKVFQGIATSKDSVYFLFDCIEQENGLIEGFSKEINEKITIEKSFVKPLLKGDDVHRYEKLETDKTVIFPYYKTVENNKEKMVLYTEDEIKDKFPNGYEYLKKCEQVLMDRERGRLKNDPFWFRYIYPKNLNLFDKEKISQPDISLGGNFSYDEKGEFYQTTTLYGYIKYSHIAESYKFYLTIFNSKLLWWYLQQVGTVMANGFFRFMPRYVNTFPLPKIDDISVTIPFEQKADEIIKAKEQGLDTTELEAEVDQMVYKLYELADDEIAIIEKSVG